MTKRLNLSRDREWQEFANLVVGVYHLETQTGRNPKRKTVFCCITVDFYNVIPVNDVYVCPSTYNCAMGVQCLQVKAHSKFAYCADYTIMTQHSVWREE